MDADCTSHAGSANEFYPHNNSELQFNQSKYPLEKVFLLWIENFIERGHNFSHICEMNITTISNKGYMTYEFFIKRPMEIVELNLKILNS